MSARHRLMPRKESALENTHLTRLPRPEPGNPPGPLAKTLLSYSKKAAMVPVTRSAPPRPGR